MRRHPHVSFLNKDEDPEERKSRKSLPPSPEEEMEEYLELKWEAERAKGKRFFVNISVAQLAEIAKVHAQIAGTTLVAGRNGAMAKLEFEEVPGCLDYSGAQQVSVHSARVEGRAVYPILSPGEQFFADVDELLHPKKGANGKASHGK